MNKTIVGVIVGILVLGGVGFAAMNMNKKDEAKTDNTPSQTTQTSTTDNMDMQPSSNTDQTSTPSTTNPASAATADVEIKGSDYTQKTITVKVGTKVTWTNKDGVQHDVMPDEDYGDAFKASEMLSRNETYSFTFTKAGTYKYHCTPHPFMKATVIVTE